MRIFREMSHVNVLISARRTSLPVSLSVASSHRGGTRITRSTYCPSDYPIVHRTVARGGGVMVHPIAFWINSVREPGRITDNRRYPSGLVPGRPPQNRPATNAAAEPIIARYVGVDRFANIVLTVRRVDNDRSVAAGHLIHGWSIACSATPRQFAALVLPLPGCLKRLCHNSFNGEYQE